MRSIRNRRQFKIQTTISTSENFPSLATDYNLIVIGNASFDENVNTFTMPDRAVRRSKSSNPCAH